MTLELALMIGRILLDLGPKVASAYQAAVLSGKQEDWDKLFKLAEEPWKDGVVGPDGLVH